MMKRLVTLVIALSALTFGAHAQKSMELGVGIGVSNFLGDLGKKNPNGKSYLGDLEASLMRPAFQLHYGIYLAPRFSLKATFMYTQFAGDDRLANTQELFDDAWYRNYRNLHFKSHALEISVGGEVNILKYLPGSTEHRWTPYFTAGVALLAFDPRAEYEGEWVRLQPLGTEGQGLPTFPDRQRYSLIQPTLPIGIGFKYNINRYLSVGLEIGHRVTFTDYLDDVSTTYPGDKAFFDYYGVERAELVYGLSRRSPEIDPEGQYQEVTQGGEARGNPQGNDAYLVSMVKVSYNISRKDMVYGNPMKKGVRKYKRVFR